MKKLILPLLMLAMWSFTGVGTTLTEAERKMAVSELTKSSNHLLEAVKGLSEAQLNFKSDPETWSVAECTEHIAISENNIFGMVEAALETDADPSKRAEVKVSDEQLLAMIVDRTNKVKTQEAFKPTGRYGSQSATLQEFLTSRKAHIDFVKNTQQDLRNRYRQLPFGTIDAFQVILFMSAHNERHVLQIEEVKASAGFPKN